VESGGKACTRNVFEGNRFTYAGLPPDDFGSFGLELMSRHAIVRNNFFYHNGGAGLTLSTKWHGGSHSNYIFQNTFFHNGDEPLVPDEYAGGLTIQTVDSGPGSPAGNVIKNNVFDQNRSGAITNDIFSSIASQIVTGNWLEAGSPSFIDDSGTDPFDPSLPDLRLQSNSPCRNAGVWLTTITSATGSGTVFDVDDANYFMDGYGITDGDLIQLDGQTAQVRIVAVDYDLARITVDTSLSWTQGQGVSLPYEGSAPDQGADILPGTAPPPGPDAPAGLRVLCAP
jgi:hypothetical protein